MRTVTRMTVLSAAVGFLCVAGLGGCRGPERENAAQATPAAAPISHIVLVKLRDPGEAGRLLEDAARALPGIPGVSMYSAGTHLDIGRATIDGEYDAAMYIGFDTVADYRVYVDHPDHTAFVARWKPRLEWIRVHDFTDLARPPRDLSPTARTSR